MYPFSRENAAGPGIRHVCEIIYMELPMMKANKVMLSELEQHNVITFKYGDNLT